MLQLVATFAALIPTRLTITYSMVRFGKVSTDKYISQAVRLFEGNHGRLRKDFG